MIPEHYSSIIAVAALSCIFTSQHPAAQNSYPASGDAHIHGLTNGTGAGILSITLATVSYQALKAALMNPVKSLRTE